MKNGSGWLVSGSGGKVWYGIASYCHRWSFRVKLDNSLEIISMVLNFMVTQA